jgi:hypothetical protein
MKIREKCNAQRSRPLRPSCDLEPVSPNGMPLSAADLMKPTFATKFVLKGWTGKGARQSTLVTPLASFIRYDLIMGLQCGIVTLLPGRVRFPVHDGIAKDVLSFSMDIHLHRSGDRQS